MAGISNYQERDFLAYLTGQSLVLALYTVAPTDAGGGTELVGNGYVRQAISWGLPPTDGSGNTTVSNNADVIFSTATANWGTIVAGAIWDTENTPHLRWWANLNPYRTVN